MEVILLDNVGSLGVLGDRVDVKPGYGRNFLIPQGKAVPATQENIEKFEARRAELEAAAAAQSRDSAEGLGTSAASGTLVPTSRSLQDEAARWFGDDP